MYPGEKVLHADVEPTALMQDFDRFLQAAVPAEIDEDARAAQANIDGARVTAHVQTSGVNQAKIAVGARKWTLYDEDIARSVLERIKEGL